MIEHRLLKVEGWGDQHVYLFTHPDVDPAGVEAAIGGSKHDEVLGVTMSYAFPEQLALTAVRLSPHELSVHWHLGTGAWERAKSKDYQQVIDGDVYKFRAYRDRSDRIVVRFQWRFDRPYCCLSHSSRTKATSTRAPAVRSSTTCRPWACCRERSRPSCSAKRSRPRRATTNSSPIQPTYEPDAADVWTGEVALKFCHRVTPGPGPLWRIAHPRRPPLRARARGACAR